MSEGRRRARTTSGGPHHEAAPDPTGGGERSTSGARSAGAKVFPLVVDLLDPHRAYLDRLCRQIEAATGVRFSPGEIVRSLVAALAEAAPVDPSTIRSAQELTELFHRRFTQQEDRRDHRDRMRL